MQAQELSPCQDEFRLSGEAEGMSAPHLWLLPVTVF